MVKMIKLLALAVFAISITVEIVLAVLNMYTLDRWDAVIISVLALWSIVLAMLAEMEDK